MGKPPFDPNRPFERVTKPPFDPSRPFEQVKTPASKSGGLLGMGEAFIEGIGNAGTLGYLPQINAMVAKGVDKLAGFEDDGYVANRDYFAKRGEKLAEENPGSYVAGNLVGAVGMPVPGLGVGKIAKTAGLLPKLGQAAKTGAIMGAAYNPGEEYGRVDPIQLKKRAMNAGTGLLAGPALTLGGAAVGKGVELGGKGLKLASKGAGKVAEIIRSTKQKPDADEILAAGKALGVTPTRAMTSDSKFVQALEESLEGSPTFAGSKIRAERKALGTGLKNVAGNLTDDATPLSPFEVGESVKRGISAKMAEEAQPISMVFDEIAASTKHIPLNEKSVGRTVKNIGKIEDVALMPDAPWSAKAQSYAKAISGATSVDQLKKIRTLADREMRAAKGPERQVLAAIKDKLTNLERTQILRGGVESAATKSQGEKIAKEIIGDLRDARKSWAKMAQGVSEFGQKTGLGGKYPSMSSVEVHLDKLPNQQVTKKLLNMARIEGAQAVKNKFPEQWELLRQSKIAEIGQKSLGPNGEMSPKKLMNQIKKLDKESLSLLFGEKVKDIGKFKKLVEALPERFNPSGTAAGQEMNALNWINLPQQAKALGQLGILKLANDGPKMGKLAQTLETKAPGLLRKGREMVVSGKRIQRTHPGRSSSLVTRGLIGTGEPENE